MFRECLRRFHCRIDLNGKWMKRGQEREREEKNTHKVTKENSVCLQNSAYYVV